MQVPNLTDVVSIAAGGYHTVALTSDGTIHTWGSNNRWQLADPIYANKTLPVQVINLNLLDNNAPTLNTIGNKSIQENALLNFTISATDSDGNALTYSASGDLIEHFNPVTRTFAWIPGYTDAGTYHITFSVSDGYLTDQETITVTVQNTNRAPSLNSIGNKSLSEADTLNFTISATDPDGNVLTYSASGDLTEHFNPVTRTFAWTPGYSDAGTYSTTFIVSDGSLTDQETITITVNDVILSYSVSIDQTYIYDTLSFTFSCSEIGKTYNYSIDDTNAATLPITGEGTITNLTQQLTDIDVSSLDDGLITLTAYLAGDLTTQETDSVIKDRSPFSGGYGYTVIKKIDHTLWAFGFNDKGQLGDGTVSVKSIPTKVGTSNWTRVSTSYKHTVAINNDGSLWAWGYNNNGQLGDGTNTDSISPIQIGTDTDWAQVATGKYHTLAIKTDGTLWAWGSNQNGQVGDQTTTNRSTPVQIGTDQDWKSITAGDYHSFALKADGSIWGWGWNYNGQLGDGTGITKTSPGQIGTDTDWIAVSAAANHTLALKSDGTLWGCGWNLHGELGDGTTTTKYAFSQIGTDSNWRQVTAIGGHTAAIKTDGSLWTWGQNTYGQLGLGTTTDQLSPVRVGTDNDWVSVSGGNVHTIAVKEDGSLWTWGSNSFGQLGTGDYSNRYAPYCIIAAGKF